MLQEPYPARPRSFPNCGRTRKLNLFNLGAVGLLRVYLDEGRDIGISDRGLLEFLGIIVSYRVPFIVSHRVPFIVSHHLPIIRFKSLDIKGVSHEIFDFSFFHESKSKISSQTTFKATSERLFNSW